MSVSRFRVPAAVMRREAERRLIQAVADWRNQEAEQIDVIEAACLWADYRPKPRRSKAGDSK